MKTLQKFNFFFEFSVFQFIECRYKSVPDNLYLYMEVVADVEVPRGCGLGTIFSQDKCICDKDPNYVRNNGKYMFYSQINLK